MVDPFLLDMMKREFNRVKKNDLEFSAKKDLVKSVNSRFDKAISQGIDEHLATLSFERGENMLISPELKKARVREELKETLEMKDLSSQIEMAFEEILQTATQDLSSDESSILMKDFMHAALVLDHFDPQTPMEKTFQQILEISQLSIESIYKIALMRFDEEHYDKCLALFTLLTLLRPDIADYWFKSAIAAQYAKNEDMALYNYSIAKQIDPELAMAHIFSAECYLRKGMRSEAKGEVAEAKKILANTDLDEKDLSSKLIAHVEVLISA